MYFFKKKKTFSETVDVRIVVWGCTKFITSMCFKKIQIKTSTCNTCCNSVFSWSQWGNAELYKLMIWPMAGKPRRGLHLAPLPPACLPGAQPPKLAPSWAALDNHLHLTCSPPRAVVAIPPRLSYPNTVLTLLWYSHTSICGSERSIIHYPPQSLLIIAHFIIV